MATEVEEKIRPPRRRLVLLVEPFPSSGCEACRGEGLQTLETGQGFQEQVCFCCKPEHREPTVDDLVEYLMGIDGVLFDQVIDHVTAGSADPGLARRTR